MADNFPVFARAVRKRFEELSEEALFVVGDDAAATWERYLDAFPPGTNPIFRTRTEFDCSCCRHFVRDVGNVVAIQNGALSTVWDLNGLPEPFQTVADAMGAHIRSLKVSDIFLTPFHRIGREHDVEMIEGRTVYFNHFAVPIREKFHSRECGAKRGAARTTHAVLMRGFTELKPEALATVSDLIARNELYRGEEHSRSVTEFANLQARFLASPEPTRELIAWSLIDSPAARFRNTVIGTLAQDLSEGVDLEAAVRMFESKVAPQNYKRTSAPISKRMVDDAMKAIQELDLEPALQRRHARFSDVSVNSVLFVDNAVAGRMKGGLTDLLMQEVRPGAHDFSRGQEIGIEDFIREVLPKARSVQVYLDHAHAANFVSMTAPVHADAGSLFRWPNNFAWAYEGNAADSIRERVKRAGGKVEGVALRVSLAWTNTDDLDLHIGLPGGGEIFYGNKGRIDPVTGGMLDVDMNVGYPFKRDAVENVRWDSIRRDGRYHVQVHNYTKRESVDVGFTVEVEENGRLSTFRYDSAVKANKTISVAVLEVARGRVVSISPGPRVVSGQRSREVWGVKTGDLVRVNSILLSPNHWEQPGVGNKHFFFILDGCRNPEPARGIFNEFLHPRFEPHRKVFEVLGDKTKVPVADEQLSGVGFSSTRRDKVSVVLTGPSLNRAYSVAF